MTLLSVWEFQKGGLHPSVDFRTSCAVGSTFHQYVSIRFPLGCSQRLRTSWIPSTRQRGAETFNGDKRRHSLLCHLLSPLWAHKMGLRYREIDLEWQCFVVKVQEDDDSRAILRAFLSCWGWPIIINHKQSTAQMVVVGYTLLGDRYWAPGWLGMDFAQHPFTKAISNLDNI